MLNVWETSNDKLINELAMLAVDFSKDDDDINILTILTYKETKNELLKRLYFGIDYRDKYEALGYAEVVTEAYYDETLEMITDEVHEIYFGYIEFEDLEELEDLYSYSDTITDGKRVAFLEW